MDNHKVLYKIEINDPLVKEEKEALRMTFPYRFNAKNFLEFDGDSVILVRIDEEPRAFMMMAANWLSNIGADENIFAIHKIDSYFTNLVSKEVMELTNTK